MIGSRAGGDELDEATRAAIDALPETARTPLLRWLTAVGNELAEARRRDPRRDGPATGSEADLERERTRVARELHDRFVSALAERASSLRIGEDIGPLISEQQRAKVERLVSEAVDAGAATCTGWLVTASSRSPITE